MTGQEALETLLARLGAAPDGVVFIPAEELARWPRSAVSVLKEAGLLSLASPAASVACDGCERACTMPVEIIDYSFGAAAFVHCDKRDDIGRVKVHLSRLERWQASCRATADFLAGSTHLRGQPLNSAHGKLWSVGMLRDKRSAHVELDAENALTLKLAGHEVPLAEVLRLKGKALIVDKQRLVECVNNPVAGGGTRESATARRQRIAARCRELFEQGHRNFRAIVAKEDGCSPETIKDILRKAGFSTRSLPRPKNF
ncbi:MAG TPA: hypothetical protein VE999_02105 [Gemmataceae bacterium]|jgi:hypothetical protein|nr:hypothetical protein [Reyranella sp.]HZV03860.1 hypothetical protein [Gemmataceae bacterium]